MKGRTTRMILSALIDLSHGYDLMIVGYRYEEAKAIAIRAVKIARALKIPCGNLTPNEDLPRVRCRALDHQATNRGPRERVHIDHSATFERGVVREQSIATVITEDPER